MRQITEKAVGKIIVSFFNRILAVGMDLNDQISINYHSERLDTHPISKDLGMLFK